MKGKSYNKLICYVSIREAKEKVFFSKLKIF